MTTFDLHLLRRFLQVFAILFVTTFGLFVVIDGFSNVDAFQEVSPSTGGTLKFMGEYYAFQSSLFLELVGQILAVIAVVVVFAMLAKHSEVQPLLAAGVPTYRLMLPMVVGILCVHLGLMINQELIIPQIAHRLQAGRSGDSKAHQVEPSYDHTSLVRISGRDLLLDADTLIGAEFVLPTPSICENLTTLRAEEAVYFPRTQNRPGGWALSGVKPLLEEVQLTANGRKIIRPLRSGGDVFVVSDVTADQMYNRNRNFTYLATSELVRRVQNPATGFVSLRAQALHLHTRLTRPLSTLAAALIAVPLIFRKESRSLITNMAVCTLTLGLMMGVGQIFQFLGSASVISADLGAWGPVIFAGTLSAWLSSWIQT